MRYHLLIDCLSKIFDVGRLDANALNFYKKISSHKPYGGLQVPMARECNVPNMNVLVLCSRQPGSHGCG